jgi:hypothetical protein
METKLPHKQFFDRDRWKIPSWIGSVLFHLCLLVLILLCFRLRQEPPTAPGERLAAGGIVLKKDSGGHEIFVDGENNEFGEKNLNTVDETSAAPTLEKMLDGSLSEADLSRNLPEAVGPRAAVKQANGVFGASNPGDLRIGGSRFPMLGGGKSGGKTLRVFGTEGTGSSFVFVFDRSGSMSEYAERPIRAAKTELVQCIDSLENLYRFNIIFYNEKLSFWKPGRKMIEATDVNKENAKRFIEGITPSGGTRHLEPLLEAVKHRPDIVFFLTDGDESDALSAGQLDKIMKDNNHRTQINVIQFGIGAKRESNFLLKLAAQNRGQYSYINVIELR